MLAEDLLLFLVPIDANSGSDRRQSVQNLPRRGDVRGVIGGRSEKAAARPALDSFGTMNWSFENSGFQLIPQSPQHRFVDLVDDLRSPPAIFSPIRHAALTAICSPDALKTFKTLSSSGLPFLRNIL